MVCRLLMRARPYYREETVFMDNDDRQIGRILSRREVLALLGTAGAALLVGCGPSQSGASAPTAASGTAATAVAQAGNPTATASGATAAAGNATVVAGNAAAAPTCV